MSNEGYRKGKDAILYYQEGGCQGGAGSWTEICGVTNDSINESAETIEATSRCSGDYNDVVPGMKSIEVSASLIYDPDNAAFAALQDAYDGGDLIGIKLLDGDSGNGLCFSAFITNFSQTRDIKDIIKIDATFTKGRDPTYPEVYRITAS